MNRLGLIRENHRMPFTCAYCGGNKYKSFLTKDAKDGQPLAVAACLKNEFISTRLTTHSESQTGMLGWLAKSRRQLLAQANSHLQYWLSDRLSVRSLDDLPSYCAMAALSSKASMSGIREAVIAPHLAALSPLRRSPASARRISPPSRAHKSAYWRTLPSDALRGLQ